MIMYFGVYFDIITIGGIVHRVAFHTISYGNDDVEVIKRNWLFNAITCKKCTSFSFFNSPSLKTLMTCRRIFDSSLSNSIAIC